MSGCSWFAGKIAPTSAVRNPANAASLRHCGFITRARAGGSSIPPRNGCTRVRVREAVARRRRKGAETPAAQGFACPPRAQTRPRSTRNAAVRPLSRAISIDSELRRKMEVGELHG